MRAEVRSPCVCGYGVGPNRLVMVLVAAPAADAVRRALSVSDSRVCSRLRVAWTEQPHDSNSGLESTSANDARLLAATLTREIRSRSTRVVYRTGLAPFQTVPRTITVAEIQRSRQGAVQIELRGDTENARGHQLNSGSFSERLAVFPEERR
jgi:hypothetical protein